MFEGSPPGPQDKSILQVDCTERFNTLLESCGGRVSVGEADMQEMIDLVNEMVPTNDARLLPVYKSFFSEELKSFARKRDGLLWCLRKMEGIPYLIEFAMTLYFKYDRLMWQMDKWTRLGELAIQFIYSSPGPESCLGDCPTCTEPLHRKVINKTEGSSEENEIFYDLIEETTEDLRKLTKYLDKETMGSPPKQKSQLMLLLKVSGRIILERK
ncbi:hypothetical protein HNY73_010901 [Argiope bruennichi]|uniref:Uncharacterized protein n=1 Tax=Argiope bruennichi TaxID=94029 RepID=A0A8T0F4W8_ARGBR|nr:hypothetical protein HNY73_010901 [Argiope bruennichi]